MFISQNVNIKNYKLNSSHVLTTSHAGSQSQAISGCVLWAADTETGLTDVYTISFLSNSTNWSRAEKEPKEVPAGLPSP